MRDTRSEQGGQDEESGRVTTTAARFGCTINLLVTACTAYRGCTVQRKLCRTEETVISSPPPAAGSTLRQAGDDGILDTAHADAFQDLKVTLVAPLAPETVGHQPVPGKEMVNVEDVVAG